MFSRAFVGDSRARVLGFSFVYIHMTICVKGVAIGIIYIDYSIDPSQDYRNHLYRSILLKKRWLKHGYSYALQKSIRFQI